ncbi:MAG: hypothetical protein RL095_1387 [Verrucomicrobiota bacterium]|jgi:hypothetical protein
MEPLNIALVLVAIAGWRLAVHFHRKKHQWSSAKAGFASLLALAAIAINLIFLIGVWKVKDPYADSVEIEARESFAQGFVLGQRLAAAFPGKRTVIIHPPLPPDTGHSAQSRYRQRIHNELLTGLRQGAGHALSLDTIAVLPPASDEDMKRLLIPPNLQNGEPLENPPQMQLTPDELLSLRSNNPFSFDLALASHKDAQLLISLEALPTGFETMSYWEKPTKQALVVCNANQLPLMKYLVDARRITAFVAQNPKFPATPPENKLSIEEVFKRKYLIVEAANAKSLAAELGPILKINNPQFLEKLNKIFIESGN